MNNEPVAWLLFRDGGESYPEYTTSYKQMREWETYLGDNERIEPHYTHPVKTDKQVLSVVALEERLNWSRLQGSGESYIEGFQDGAEWAEQQVFNPAKTLTDEEIMDEWWHETSNGFEIHTDTPLSFARAILRKAQENV